MFVAFAEGEHDDGEVVGQGEAPTAPTPDELAKKARVTIDAARKADGEEPTRPHLSDANEHRPGLAAGATGEENLDAYDADMRGDANKASPGEDEDRALTSLKAKYPRAYALFDAMQEGGDKAVEVAKVVGTVAEQAAVPGGREAVKAGKEAVTVADEVARASGAKDKVEAFVKFLTGLGGKEDQIRQVMASAPAGGGV
jgi:hypothetical protein